MTTLLAGDDAATLHDELVALAREFARDRIAPRALALDAGDRAAFDACWSGLVTIGLDRALLPEEHGGCDLPAALLPPLLEELAAADGGIAACVLLSNAALAALPREALPTGREGERWVLALPPAPPAAGSATLLVERMARAPALLHGTVPAALGALGAAGVVLLPAPTAHAPLLVPSGTPGLRATEPASQLGLRAAAAADLQFDGAELGTLVGFGPGFDGPRLRSLLHAGIAAIADGVARRAYRIALDYAEQRIQGGGPIIGHGAVRSLLAGMAARLHARQPAGRSLGAADALAARIRATDDAVKTTLDAVQVLGGIGYMREAGAEKLMRDAKQCQLYPEPNWVARDELLELERRVTGLHLRSTSVA